MPPTEALSRDDYTVGWVTALPLELAAATAMLDEEHKRPPNFRQPSTDHNTYTWGCIEKHNVILASLPAGVYGTVSAATVASSLLSSFPHLQVGLMVGIGAGIPRPGYDIRLGDVVVSNPGGQTGGVIQYDLGKRLAGGRFERKGSLNMPPEVLLTALATLQARHEREPSNVPQILEQMLRNNPFMAEPQDERPGYGYQGEENDRLFVPDYQHVGDLTCEGCDRDKEVERKKRKSSAPRIHYGIIASGNTLVKDSSTRDSIIEGLDEDCICFEMEAAGLMNSFPCLVIRGICDYADSHKNDRWQRCTAAAAASYAKEFLSVVPDVSAPSPRRTNKRLTDETKQSHILKALKFDAMDDRFHDVSQEARNTFEWIFNDDGEQDCNPLFKAWLIAGSGMFHICGKFGSGKSTLMKYIWKHYRTAESLELWAQERQQQLVKAQFFFWQQGSHKQKSFAGLVRSLLAQILSQCPEMIDALFSSKLYSNKWPLHGQAFNITISDDEAVEAFNRLIHDEAICSTHCFCFFIDGLDEFEEQSRSQGRLVQDLNEWVSGNSIKLCVSSKKLVVFEHHLSSVSRRIELQDLTYLDIWNLVEQTLKEDVHFQRLYRKNPVSCGDLIRKVAGSAEGTILWVVLALTLLSEGLENQYSIDDLFGILRDIPGDLTNLFKRMLDSIPESQRPKSICMLAIVAKLHELDSQPWLCGVPKLTVFSASFLNDYFQDPRFAEKRDFQEMSDSEIKERLIESEAQWVGRCKGLIEVRFFPCHMGSIFPHVLKFTHRAAFEYICKSGGQFQGVEILDPLMQSFLAVVRAVPQYASRYLKDHSGEIRVIMLILREYSTTRQSHYFPMLEQIETALQERQVKIWPGFWNWFVPGAKWGTLDLSLSHVACDTLFHEYITRKCSSTPDFLQRGPAEGFDYLVHAVEGMIRENNPLRGEETLRVLFQQGCNPNDPFPPKRTDAPSAPREDLWTRIFDPERLCSRMSPRGFSGRWKAVEILLESGAYRPQWIGGPATYRPYFKMTYRENGRGIIFNMFSNHKVIPPCLRKVGGSALLEDWVEFEKPDNADAILKLLKRPD